MLRSCTKVRLMNPHNQDVMVAQSEKERYLPYTSKPSSKPASFKGGSYTYTMAPRFGIAWEDPIGNILSSFVPRRSAVSKKSEAHTHTRRYTKKDRASNEKPTVEAQHEIWG